MAVVTYRTPFRLRYDCSFLQFLGDKLPCGALWVPLPAGQQSWRNNDKNQTKTASSAGGSLLPAVKSGVVVKNRIKMYNLNSTINIMLLLILALSESGLRLTTSDLEDHELIRGITSAIKKNGREAERIFKILYEKYRIRLFLYIKSRIWGNESLAMDLFQEIMCKIYFNLEKFNFNHKYVSYMFRIAHNNIIDCLRKNRRSPVSLNQPVYSEENIAPLIDFLKNHEPELLQIFTRQETITALYREIALLPDRLKEIFIMKFYNEMTFCEISGITGQSLRNVKYQVKKACIILKNRLEEQGVSLE